MWRFCGRNARNFTSIRKKNMVCRRVSDPPVFSESDLLDMVFFEFLSVWSFQGWMFFLRNYLTILGKSAIIDKRSVVTELQTEIS